MGGYTYHGHYNTASLANLNLKPGISPNPKGKPRGLQIRDVVRKCLTYGQAEEIVLDIIKGAVSGSIQKQRLLLQITGDLKPETNIKIENNNSPLIGTDLIQAAKEYLSKKSSIVVDTSIVDNDNSSSVILNVSGSL